MDRWFACLCVRMCACLYLHMLPFIQIDWGDMCSGAEEVNIESTVEEEVDWGISVESGKEVTQSHSVSLTHLHVTV